MEMVHPLSDVVWEDILGYVRTRHPSISRGWFVQLHPADLTGGQLAIAATNLAQLDYLDSHCVRPFVEAAQAATGRLISVRFYCRGGNKENCASATGDPAKPAALPATLIVAEPDALCLNVEYVFENFVVGPCNRLSHASCVAVSESPGTGYNPLFVHGNVGLGKTHLLQAICHKVVEHYPTAKILYLTCEMFVNQFIEAVERGLLDGFRYRYRHVDVLLIDDIQFLAGHERTQEEFFHTFNTLYQLQKQIILTADCSPTELPSLEERLVSRFNWGLVARIDSPCFETRLAIIRKKARLRQMELPEDVATFLGERIKANTRELEGALNQLRGLACADGRPIDMALARQALGEPSEAATHHVRIQDIMNLIAERYGVKLSDLQGRKRNRTIALSRHIGMYLARRQTSHSLAEIGGFFGGRDHTTVLHANKLITRRRESDFAFRSQLEELETTLQESETTDRTLRQGKPITPR